MKKRFSLTFYVAAVLWSGCLLGVGCAPTSDVEVATGSGTPSESEAASTEAVAEEPVRMYSPEAFLEAALNGKRSVVQVCLDEKLAVDAPDPNGITPLAAASYNGHTDVVKLLLENGADVNSRDAQGNTPLIHASGGKHPETVQTLIDSGAIVDAVDNGEGFSALMLAASEGNLEVVRVLLKAGADAKKTDADGETAYDFAMKKGYVEIGELLQQ